MKETHPSSHESPAGPNNPSISIPRLRAVLLQINQIAREASLTGCLGQGNRSSAVQFNRILRAAEQAGIDLGGLFEPLDEEASFDQIGVAAAQLAGYLEFDSHTPPFPPVPPIPPQPPVPPTPPVPPPPPFFGPPHGPHGSPERDPNFLKDIDHIKGIGQMIREQLPEWIKREVEARISAAQQSCEPQEPNATGASAHGTQRLPDPMPDPAGPPAVPGSAFRDMDMSRARFSDTSLVQAAFSDVDMSHVEFNDVNLSAVTFSDVEMAGTRFHDTNFTGSAFHDVNFTNCRFHDATFCNVEVHDGDVRGLKINGIDVYELMQRYHREQQE